MSALNETVRPDLADVYFDWESEANPAPTPALGSIVAIAATSDWGPANTVEVLNSWDDYLTIFGGSYTPLSKAVYRAFKGQGINGVGGAGQVLAYRQAGSTLAKATKTLLNTASSPAVAITLTAKQPGSRADRLSFTVQAGADEGQNELLVLDGAVVVEQYEHDASDLASLVQEINALSDWFEATLEVDGTPLADVSSTAAAGGDDGATLTGADWTATFTAFDCRRWNIFPAFGITDSATTASIIAWIQDRNSLGERCMAIFGGAIDEPLSDAIIRSLDINDYNIINLGEGRLTLLDEGVDVSTAEFTARYAGARAWRGESRDDIFVRFADVELASGATLTEQSEALKAGVVVFSRDTDPVAPVFIREAVNTYTDDSLSPLDPQGVKYHPVKLYKRIKNIAIQQGIELEVRDWARSGDVLGALPVNEKDRELVLARVRLAYANREAAQVVQPGWTVTVAGTPSDDDDFFSYLHGFHPTRSLRQIFNVARIG